MITLTDKSGAVVATTTADINGNFRVVVGRDDAAQNTVTKFALDISTVADDNELIPVYHGYQGNASVITVVAAPTIDQVPVILTPVHEARLASDTPTLTGFAKEGEVITVVLSNPGANLNLTLPPDAYAGSGTTDPVTGAFEITLTQSLPGGYNYVSVLVDGVSSALFTYIINEIQGVVFDTTTNQVIKNARVSILKADGTLAQAGVELNPQDINPFMTGVDGVYYFYSTLPLPYTMTVDVPGYNFPTTLSDAQLPPGRVILPASRGEAFTTTGAMVQIDLPVDANAYLFKVEKIANKKEARIGEVVTYTLSIESISDAPIISAGLVDVIPPGFKFMAGRAQLDGVPMPDPAGNRPLSFVTGDFAPQQKKILRYQLVIGAGVAQGAYENVAMMKYPGGKVISNRATEMVKVVLDPLFDAGTVFGKVFYDWNENGRQDDPDYIYEDRQEVVEGALSNVRIVMEDGTVVTADNNGQFHIPALLPGRHLVRLDEATLPAGAYLTTDKVQVIDVTPGSIIKVNFGVNMDNAQIVGPDA